MHTHSHHDHDSYDHHGHSHHHHPTDSSSLKRLIYALIPVFLTFAAEILGSWMSGSLSLLSDAGHLASDMTSLLISINAVILSRKKPSLDKPFGWKRIEVLAAFVNSLLLIPVSIWIGVEAFHRILEPAEVHGHMIIWVGLAAIVGNFTGAAILHSYADYSLNMKSAYLHLLSDLMGSIGVVTGGVIIHLTGWKIIDPIISGLIMLLILRIAFNLMRDTAKSLLEFTPSNISFADVEKTVLEYSNALKILELKIWSLSSRENAASLHLQIADDFSKDRLKETLKEKYRLSYVFIEIN
ncbi:MAG TPA: cation diffusion facilitator family transporter [Leptospiraceae bacterium]|nr:cation diffusion facilitator family transporter [Leptospiraceae bacterium]